MDDVPNLGNKPFLWEILGPASGVEVVSFSFLMLKWHAARGWLNAATATTFADHGSRT
jgi:hypothetical protein